MKKIIMSLGFALATVLGVQAQETPQDRQGQTEEQQTQQDPSMTEEQAGDEAEDMSAEGTPDNADMAPVSESELPQEVKDGIKNSDYKNATIEQVYEISGSTVDQIVNNRQKDATGASNDRPDKLYQVQVTTEDEKSVMLYLTEDGEVLDESPL